MDLEPGELLLVLVGHFYVRAIIFKIDFVFVDLVRRGKIELERVCVLSIKIVIKYELEAISHFLVYKLEILCFHVVIYGHLAEKGIEDLPVKTEVEWDSIKDGFPEQLAEEVEELSVALYLIGIWSHFVGKLLGICRREQAEDICHKLLHDGREKLAGDPTYISRDLILERHTQNLLRIFHCFEGCNRVGE